MNKKYLLLVAFFALLIVIVFKSWFTFSSLSTGDWEYKFPETIKAFTVYPYAWDFGFGNGLGGNNIFLLALESYFFGTTYLLFNLFHLPWILIERMLWYWPFLIVSSLGSFFLFKRLINNAFGAIFSAFIFLFNTYALMLVGGGQMGVAWGYALIPFVILSFLQILKKLNGQSIPIKEALIAGLCFSLELMFDLRMAYVALVAVVLIYLVLSKKNIRSIIYFLLIPFVTTLLIHFFWLLPFILMGQNPLEKLGEAFSGAGMVKYLSFASFENSISLLHPNWPDNIFGKVGFMKPEFLILPILAFASLLFIGTQNKEQNSLREKAYVICFALIGVLGAFLAKGANEPFGNSYIWMFKHVPFFQMFRDSTKWYALVAVSYSILIPFSVFKTYEWLRLQRKFLIRNRIFNFQNMFVVFIVLYFLFLIRPALLNRLKGTFVSRELVREYVQLEEFLVKDPDFFRTAWIPAFHQFSFSSPLHPKGLVNDFLGVSDGAVALGMFSSNNTKRIIQEAAVKYIIIPYDSEGKIFLEDRKYSEKEYEKTANQVSGIPWLTEIKRFGEIRVFEVPYSKDHFYISSQQSETNSQLSYKYISPVEYKVSLENVKKGDLLVFSESFDSLWIASNQKSEVASQKSDGLFNSFRLPEDGSYDLKIYYQPQSWVNIGLIVSGLSLVSVLLLIFGSALKKW
jgi:hypothetical protein